MDAYDEQLLPYQEECVLNFMDIMNLPDRETAITIGVIQGDPTTPMKVNSKKYDEVKQRNSEKETKKIASKVSKNIDKPYKNYNHIYPPYKNQNEHKDQHGIKQDKPFENKHEFEPPNKELRDQDFNFNINIKKEKEKPRKEIKQQKNNYNYNYNYKNPKYNKEYKKEKYEKNEKYEKYEKNEKNEKNPNYDKPKIQRPHEKFVEKEEEKVFIPDYEYEYEYEYEYDNEKEKEKEIPIHESHKPKEIKKKASKKQYNPKEEKKKNMPFFQNRDIDKVRVYNEGMAINKFKKHYKFQNYPQFETGFINDVYKKAYESQKLVLIVADNFQDDYKEFYQNTICSSISKSYIDENFCTFFCDASSPEGISIVSEFEISYPSLLFINPENRVMIYFIVGFGTIYEPNLFINDVKSAITRYKTQIEEEPITNANYPDSSLNQFNDFENYNFEDEKNKPVKNKFTYSLKEEQEREFIEALKIDREREELKQKKEWEEKLKKEEENKKKNEEEDAQTRAKKQEEYLKKREEQLRSAKESSIPPEPTENDPNSALLIFRFPTGKKIQRRFPKQIAIPILYNFIDTLLDSGVKEGNYSIIQTMPKFVYEKASNETLESSGLFPQSLLQIMPNE